MDALMLSNGSPPAAAQRPNSNGHPLASTLSRKPDVGHRPTSAVCFLLLDSSLRPVAFNAEAIRVLGYPDRLVNVRPADVFLAQRIRESLLNPEPSRESPLVAEFRSGRRRYLCRRFSLDSDATRPLRASIAFLPDRTPYGRIHSSPVSEA